MQPDSAPAAIPSIQELVRLVKQASPHKPTKPAPFPPLESETRSHVETACAGFHLNRKDQTMRVWACYENGPIRPIRINGRLAWPVAEIRRILAEGAKSLADAPTDNGPAVQSHDDIVVQGNTNDGNAPQMNRLTVQAKASKRKRQPAPALPTGSGK